MKISKKITSLLLVMLIALSTCAFAITANAATYPISPVTLNIHKYALPDEDGNDDYIGNSGKDANPTSPDLHGATALDGVTFKIYKVGDMTATQGSYTASENDLKATVTTQNGGLATFTVQPADFGLYYVVETDAPASVTTKSTPFYVYLPSTNAAGTDWLTEVNVYPKNLTTLGNTTLTKTVNTGAYDSSAVSGTPTFKLVDEATNEAVVTFYLASTTNPTATYSVDTTNYPSVTASVSGGVMSVSGLPVGTYHWEETVGVTLNGTALPTAANSASFTIDENGENNTFTMDNSAKPTVSKTVSTPTASIGTDVVWTITPSIPSDIATYKVYKVTDTIDSRLNFAGTGAVEVIGLTEGQYKLTVTDRTVTVEVTAAGRTALAAEGASLTIKITTQINSTAVVDEAIENKARLDFTNQYDVSDYDEDTDSVLTGGALFQKVDASTNAGLSGAQFQLQDSNGNTINVDKTADGEYVVNPAANSNTVVSGTNGKIFIKGLAYGKYNLVEVKAPTGYQLITAPFEFTVSATSDTTAFVIKNVPQPDLPLTGGMGTMLFTIVGLVLIGGGAFFFLRSRKSKKEEI